MKHLGNTATTVTRTGPAELTCERISTLGLNATELHVLGDWLESPKFPQGFYSLLLKMPPLPPRHPGAPPPPQMRTPPPMHAPPPMAPRPARK